jgi:hypothetical protein
MRKDRLRLAQMEGEAGDAAPPMAASSSRPRMCSGPCMITNCRRPIFNAPRQQGRRMQKCGLDWPTTISRWETQPEHRPSLAAVSAVADERPDYQYLLAEANVLRQQHHDAQALTSFAQASNAEGEDQTAEQALLQAGADEGLRITPVVSLLSDFSVEPIFEDSTVYVLDSKLDASFPVPSSDTALLPPPRSSLETQSTNAYHLHLGNLPTATGFFQVRNAQGQISVPSTNSIVNRDTTDYTFNVGVNPTINIGNNVLTFNSGIQATIRRDSESPVAMNQNLFRVFTYMSTSSFFNAVSVSGYVIRESGPFTESNLHSQALPAALIFASGRHGENCPGDWMGSQRSAVLASELRGLLHLFLYRH